MGIEVRDNNRMFRVYQTALAIVRPYFMSGYGQEFGGRLARRALMKRCSDLSTWDAQKVVDKIWIGLERRKVILDNGAKTEP